MSVQRNRLAIKKLERSLASVAATVAALERERERVQLAVSAAHIAALNATALAELCEAVVVQQEEGGGSGGGQQDEGPGPPRPACQAGAPAPRVNRARRAAAAGLATLSLELYSWGKHPAGPAGSGANADACEAAAAGGALPPPPLHLHLPPAALAQPHLAPLGWSPRAAAARARAAREAGEITLAGLRSAMREFATLAGMLLPRVKYNAPDAASAHMQLAEGKASLHELGCLVAAQGEASVLSEVLLSPLAGAPPAEAGGGPGPEHWVYAVAQLGLSIEQEAYMLAALDLWAARAAELTRRREELLRAATQTAAGDGLLSGVQDGLLEELAALQLRYQLCTTVFVVTCNCSLMSPTQFAAYMVAAQPWCPSLTALHAGLRELRARRASSASGGGASTGGSGQPGGSGAADGSGPAGGSGAAAGSSGGEGGGGGGVRRAMQKPPQAGPAAEPGGSH